MSGEIPRPLGSIALIATLVMSGVGITVPARADDCLAAPNSPAPQGSHWYYRLDWATQRKCWYMRRPVQQAAAPAALARVTPVHSLPVGSGSVRAAGGAPMSESSGDSAPPSPHVTMLAVKPTSEQEIAATVDKLAQGNAQEGNTALSMMEARAPQANTSSQTNAQADAPTVAPVAWPDAPPAVAALKAPTAIAVPIDTLADAVSVGADRTDRGGKAINNTAMPIIIFPILALGLTVVGMLSMKVAAARRARAIRDHAEPDMVADLRQHEVRHDYDQHGSVDQRREYQSLISAVSDYGPFTAEGGADQITPEISKRRDKLARLHQELDRLLQSPTPA
jgi:hypothetical protein